jgi:hypothetical protein
MAGSSPAMTIKMMMHKNARVQTAPGETRASKNVTLARQKGRAALA